MCFAGNKRECDFNELVYGPRNHWPEDLEILLSLDSKDFPCHHVLHPLCQCGVLDRQGMVSSEFGYDYFYGNIFGEDDA
jgi:hypothetical protein